MRTGGLIRARSLVKAAAEALMAFPEPVITAAGAVLLSLNDALPQLTGVEKLATCPPLSSTSLEGITAASDAGPLPLSGQFGSGASVRGREMAQRSLPEMLKELASRIRSLETEKREAVAKIGALEREVGELRSLISLAGAKVDEMLKEGTTADTLQPHMVTTHAE